MANASKDFNLSLLQINPARDAMLNKMRQKLAGVVPDSVERDNRLKDARKKKTLAWSLRVCLGILVIAANFFLIDNKDALLAKIGYEGVPSLPKPSAALSADEQALYWTYALYDFGKFKARFGVNGYYAINQSQARKNLEALMPKLSMSTLGTISAYTSVAFKSVAVGGTP